MYSVVKERSQSRVALFSVIKKQRGSFSLRKELHQDKIDNKGKATRKKADAQYSYKKDGVFLYKKDGVFFVAAKTVSRCAQ